MINLGSITNENNREHNEKLPLYRDNPYRILIICGSGSERTKALPNSIKEKGDIEKNIFVCKRFK